MKHSNSLTLRAARRSLIALMFVWISTGFAMRAQGDPLTAAWNAFRFSPGGTAGVPQTPHPAVARIVSPEPDGVSYGSGTLVDSTGEYALVITNWHVVKDASGVINVVFPDGFQSPAQVVKLDKDWDLAALAVWKPTALPVMISNSPPRLGENLTIAGYGEGQYRSASGVCTQYLSPERHLPQEIVELSAAARNGDSGGPIFNSRGELAGVLFGANRRSTAGSHCGRVNQFLAPIMENARRSTLDASQLAATPRPADVAPVDALAVNNTATNSFVALAPIQTWPAPTVNTVAVAQPQQLAAMSMTAASAPPVDTSELDEVADELADSFDAASTPQTSRQIAPFPPLPGDGPRLDGPLMDWRTWTGESTFEKTKSGLAALGVLMLIAKLRPKVKAAAKSK